jgi:hypothetical protein
MKKYFILYTSLLLLCGLTSCKKYLDINSDPDTPQNPDASSVFPAMLAGIPRGTQYDARYVSKYIQNFAQSTSGNVWDIQSYQDASDNGGDIWRQCYFGLGANLNYIINEGIKKSQWDYVGAAYALKALMFQMATDEYGEIIYTEAFKENTSAFRFDDQPTVYRGVDSLCRLALFYLKRTDISASASRLSKSDFVYNGNTAQWVKFTNGLLARNFHRVTNKNSLYKPDSVIYYCDQALASITDDFLIPFDASKNDDSNFFGPYRDNLTTFRQTKFIVSMMDGTFFTGSSTAANRDPRMKHMLSVSNDTSNGNGGYRGVDVGLGETLSGNLRTAAPFGDSLYANPSASRFDPTKGKYLFRDKVVSPVMTYAEIQFIKAEALYRKGSKDLALTAYRNAINAHFDFINRSTNIPRSNTPLFNNTAISATERAAYLASGNVKSSVANFNLTDIMIQKYIALWGWGFFETWVDMRRYHYTDSDLGTGQPVYKGYVTPSFAATNFGKFAQRIRPRYNSEYVWNITELQRIGAAAPDYHTKEMWFSQP